MLSALTISGLPFSSWGYPDYAAALGSVYVILLAYFLFYPL